MTVCTLLVMAPAGHTQLLAEGANWSEETAMQHSQQAVGRTLADHGFTRTDGSRATLSDYTGKPLLISLVFTSCHHVCPMTTQHLDEAVEAAREALGRIVSTC